MGSECFRSQCKYLLRCCLQNQNLQNRNGCANESSDDLGHAEKQMGPNIGSAACACIETSPLVEAGPWEIPLIEAM